MKTQTYKFPSEHTILNLIGPYPIQSSIAHHLTTEKIIQEASRFFANQTKTRDEIATQSREIVNRNMPNLCLNNLNVASQDLLSSLMYIVEGHGRMQWDINAPGRKVVLYDRPQFYG